MLRRGPTPSFLAWAKACGHFQYGYRAGTIVVGAVKYFIAGQIFVYAYVVVMRGNYYNFIFFIGAFYKAQYVFGRQGCNIAGSFNFYIFGGRKTYWLAGLPALVTAVAVSKKFFGRGIQQGGTYCRRNIQHSRIGLFSGLPLNQW